MLIILIIILYSIFFYHKLRLNVDLRLKSKKALYVQILNVIVYILLFFVFLRFLRFVREHKNIDLVNIEYNKYIIVFIMSFIMIFFVQRLIVLYAKVSFFKIHYYVYFEEKSIKHLWYQIIFNLFFYLCYSYYNIIKIINVVFTIILIIFIIKDLLFNSFVLDFSVKMLRGFGVFKFFYIIVKFVATKQDPILDIHIRMLTYPEKEMSDEYNDYLKHNPILKVLFEKKGIEYKEEIILK